MASLTLKEISQEKKMTAAFDAMVYAREQHRFQTRQGGRPYTEHLAEVAGLVATAVKGCHPDTADEAIAVAWLHDIIEDQRDIPNDPTGEAKRKELEELFGANISYSVMALSDHHYEGLREDRLQQYSKTLSNSISTVQTVKVADIISNTSSVLLDMETKFAEMYLREKMFTLNYLQEADSSLRDYAIKQVWHLQVAAIGKLKKEAQQ